MAERYNFKYLPLVGKLPGKSMVEQTETAINELASVVYDNVGYVGNLAEEVQTANTNASNALDKATEALETSGRVYIKQIAAVDVNDYYDSELYYINNDGSTNIPVRDRGFLEVKTNDDKTACEQVFIADSTGTPYYRHGVITEQTLGEETTYVVTWGSWYQGATTEYVQGKLTNYLPLSGGTINGDLSFTGGSRKINFSNGKSQVVSFGNGVYVYGDTADKPSSFVAFTNENGSGFQINAGDGTTQRRMIGNPDGTLTWDNKGIERVSAKGTYGIRFESGIQICWGELIIPAGTSGREVSGTMTFPYPFANTNYVLTFGNDWLSSSTEYYRAEGRNTENFKFTAAGVHTNLHRAFYIAIGYWK